MGPARWRLIMKETAKAVHDTRKLFGWSQEGLARKAGVSQGTISRLESGNCAAIPFHTIVSVLHELSKGISEVGLPISPAVQGLFTFVNPSLGPVVKATDANFASFAHAYHRCTPTQKHAVSQFLIALTSESLTRGDEAGTSLPPSLD